MRKSDQLKKQREIAAAVREAIAQVPPLNDVKLEVFEAGIYPSLVADQTWWRVPVIATPPTDRLFPVYEIIAEVQQHIRAAKNNIILFPEDASNTVAA